MADNAGETIAKVVSASASIAEAKAPDTGDSLPPITKEPAGTAEAAMAPSVPAEPATAEAAVPSSDTANQPEASAAAEAKEEATNNSNEPEAAASEQEKSVPAVPQPETKETVTSAVESSAPGGSNDKAVEPPKPVSLKEIQDEDLPAKKSSDAKEQAVEAQETDASAPIATTDAETSEVSAVDSSPAKNGDVAANNKRKADVVEDIAKLDAENTKDEHAEPPEKKHKTNGATTNGAARKPGRPRKDKTVAVPVGKTARKTRSQGAAD
ncbi:hypothetical protein GGR51DRAFT_558192 [Nemania sp. FL0031]|nr:hypothetical protein GGR51DRAFT_558192 [Nemania sp. FL0031]